MAHLSGVQAHFAVSAWFYSSVRVRQQGMLPLQDGSHKDCLLFVPQTTVVPKLRYICEMTKGMGKFFDGSKEMLNGWYKEVAIVAMLQLLQLLQCCNKVYSTR